MNKNNASTLLVKNALYLGKTVDVLIKNGTIAEFGTAIKSDAEVFDAKGLVLFPSFTDAHVHLREPGFEYKESIASGLEAAVYGGFANIMCMANTEPVNDTASTTRFMLEQAKKHWPDGPRLFPIGAATIGLKGEEMSPLAELLEAGCKAFSNDGAPVPNTELFRRCMEYASDLDCVLIDHCEDPYLAKKTHMNEGLMSGKLGLKGQPDVGEALHVARDILLADYLDISVHLAHISCRRSVELIAWAKSRGVKVTAETCPHYLLLTEEAMAEYDSNAKVNPPLRTQDDVDCLREAVKNGTIDCMVTDHAPHAAHEKEHPIDESPCGFSGLDTAVSLTWSLVEQGVITQEDCIKLWSNAPTALFKLPCNTFAQGDSADFFLFDPKTEWVVSPETFHSKSCNTPFLGKTLKGRVQHHWIKGVKVV